MSNAKVAKVIDELKSCSRLEQVAVGVSAATIVAFVVFWIVQIRSVLELLELAYG